MGRYTMITKALSNMITALGLLVFLSIGIVSSAFYLQNETERGKENFICGVTSDDVVIDYVLPNNYHSSDIPGTTITMGKSLFSQNCMACHSAGSEVVVGPGLAELSERRSKKWLQDWIRNSQAVIASGDEYGISLYEEYNKAVMTAFPTFKDEEIDAILVYIDGRFYEE